MNVDNIRKIVQECPDKDLKRIFKDLSERSRDAWQETLLATVVKEMAERN